MNKLILCAGDRRLSGYELHDVLPLDGLTYQCDFFEIPLKIIKKYDEIQFTHALEHFPTAKIPDVLKIVYDLLNENGKLYIEVPNFGWHAALIFEGKDRQAVYYAFGGQLNEYDFHKTGFTKDILSEDLTKAGFRNIEIKNNSSLECHCQK